MFLSFLLGRRPAVQRPDLRVVLYTRRGCHLCEAAWDILHASQRRHGFVLEMIDVDTSPELASAYGTWVPVTTVNGTLRFRGTVNGVLLQRIVDARPPSA